MADAVWEKEGVVGAGRPWSDRYHKQVSVSVIASPRNHIQHTISIIYTKIPSRQRRAFCLRVPHGYHPKSSSGQLCEAAKRHCSSEKGSDDSAGPSSGQMPIASTPPHRKDARRKTGESGASENQLLRKRVTIRQSRPNGSSGFAAISMKSMSAKEAKNGFGLLLDTARAAKRMMPWLLGQKANGSGAGKQDVQRLLHTYVAMTRPSHLLCLAVSRSALGGDQVLDQNISALKGRGWQVAKIVDRAAQWID